MIPSVCVRITTAGNVAISRTPAVMLVTSGRSLAISAWESTLTIVVETGTSRRKMSAVDAFENPGPNTDMIPVAAPPPTPAKRRRNAVVYRSESISARSKPSLSPDSRRSTSVGNSSSESFWRASRNRWATNQALL